MDWWLLLRRRLFVLFMNYFLLFFLRNIFEQRTAQSKGAMIVSLLMITYDASLLMMTYDASKRLY